MTRQNGSTWGVAGPIEVIMEGLFGPPQHNAHVKDYLWHLHMVHTMGQPNYLEEIAARRQKRTSNENRS